MNLDDLPPEIGFLFITIGHAAVSAYNQGMSQEQFCEFCKGMWETMEMNGPEGFGSIIEEKMMSDIDSSLGGGMFESLKETMEGKGNKGKK